jgi:hypothetical protein
MLPIYLTLLISNYYSLAVPGLDALNGFGLDKIIDPKRITKVTDEVVKPLIEKTGLPLMPQEKKKVKEFKEDMREKPDSSSSESEKASSTDSGPDLSSFSGLGPMSLNAGSEGTSGQGSSQNGVDYRFDPYYSYSPYTPIYQGSYNEIPRYDQYGGYGATGYSDYSNYPSSYGGYGTDPYNQYSSGYSPEYSMDPYSQYSQDPYFEYANSPTYQFNNDHYPVRDMYSWNDSPYYEGPRYLSNNYPYFG